MHCQSMTAAIIDLLERLVEFLKRARTSSKTKSSISSAEHGENYQTQHTCYLAGNFAKGNSLGAKTNKVSSHIDGAAACNKVSPYAQENARAIRSDVLGERHPSAPNFAISIAADYPVAPQPAVVEDGTSFCHAIDDSAKGAHCDCPRPFPSGSHKCLSCGRPELSLKMAYLSVGPSDSSSNIPVYWERS